MTDTAGSMDTSKAKSLEDIAALMAENTMKMRGLSPNEVTDDDDITIDKDDQKISDDVANDDDTSTDDDGLNKATEDGDDEANDRVDDDESTGDDSSSDGDFEITDDTMFALDDDTEVSFADLRERYTANEEVTRLAQEQKEVLQEAVVTRQRALQESEAAKQAAMAVFEHFETLISTPLVKEPDPGLKASNPALYIEHLEYYNQDQARIRQQKSDLSAALGEHLKQEDELKKGLKQQMITDLETKLPALKGTDVAAKKRASQDILDAAGHYGFSEEEVQGAVDARLYHMAHDAQQYRKLMQKSGKSSDDVQKEKPTRVKNQTRTLRPRGTTAKNRLTAKAKRVKVLTTKAKKSGRVQDVADLMAAKMRS